MKRTSSKEINGHMWTVTQFPAGKGVKLLTTLIKLMGPSLVSMVGSLKGGKGLLDADIDMGKLEPAIMSLAERLDEDDVLNKIRSMVELTRKDGEEVMPQFNTMFQGDYLTMFKVLAFVVEVNYGSFFGENGTDVAKEEQAGKEA